MKYLIYKHKPIIFSEEFSHSDIAKSLGKPNSAGIVDIIFEDNDITVECYDNSHSLNIFPKDTDEEDIMEIL